MVRVAAMAFMALLAHSGCKCEPEGVGSRTPPSSPPEPSSESAASKAETLELDMDHRWNVKNSCGEECMIRSTGSADVSLGLLVDGSARAMDTGTLTHAEASDGLLSHWTRSWTLTYLGTWKGTQGKRTIELALDSIDCSEMYETAESTSTQSIGGQRDCPPVSAIITLTCFHGQVDIQSDEADARAPAWLCGTAKPVDHPGTPLPWVFGSRDVIETLETELPPDGELTYSIVDEER